MVVVTMEEMEDVEEFVGVHVLLLQDAMQLLTPEAVEEEEDMASLVQPLVVMEHLVLHLFNIQQHFQQSQHQQDLVHAIAHHQLQGIILISSMVLVPLHYHKKEDNLKWLISHN